MGFRTLNHLPPKRYLCGVTVLLLTVLSICVLAVLHTYLFYPIWVVWKARKVQPLEAQTQVQTPPVGASRHPQKGEVEEAMNWPSVHVLMAVHNEESVLESKLQSLAAQDYSGELLFLIGSDNSSDRTNEILTAWAAKDDRFRPTLFSSRQGKPGIINQLALQRSAVSNQRAAGNASSLENTPDSRAERASTSPLSSGPRSGLEETSGEAAQQKEPGERSLNVLILTDASVLLRSNVITELVRPMLKNERIGVVDTTMVQTGGKAEGIGLTEEQYIHREVNIKRAEGQLWGAMIGPFGGCWAIRAEAYHPVPENFLVDDFFLCMAAYEAGWQGISSEKAIVEEAVGQTIKGEFRRKVRISGGNWQNLFRFCHLWWFPTKNALAFALFSHKILRWWTPFFLLIGALCVGLLVLPLGNHWAATAFGIGSLLLVLSLLLDLALAPMGIHLKGLRSLRYFLAMNAALLVGFYRFLTGITTNVWQPSNRN